MRRMIAAVFLVSCSLVQATFAQENDPFGWRATFEVKETPWHPFLDFLDPKFASFEPEWKTIETRLASFQWAAGTLARANLTPPVARISHFDWLLSNTKYEFQGWHGFVTDVEPIPGGHLVTVRVSARTYMMMNSDHVIERYSIVDGKVRFQDGDFKKFPVFMAH